MNRNKVIDTINDCYSELHRCYNNSLSESEQAMLDSILALMERMLDRIDPQ